MISMKWLANPNRGVATCLINFGAHAYLIHYQSEHSCAHLNSHCYRSSQFVDN